MTETTRIIAAPLTAAQIATILSSDVPFSLAMERIIDAGLDKATLRELILRARDVMFDSHEARDTAAQLFGPSIYAKARTPKDAVGPGVLQLDLDGTGKRIDQITPTFTRRDAISDEALLLRDSLRASKFRSTIWAPIIAEDAAPFVERYEGKPPSADLLVVHFAIASDTSETALSRSSGRRALWYHNITPGSFFRRYDVATEQRLEAGRAQLRRIAPRYDVLIADSEYNARELQAIVDRAVEVVPFPIDFRRFDVRPVLPRTVSPASTRWLSVGRIAPSKGLLRLVRAFAAFAAERPGAQLVLAGAFRAADPFTMRLLYEIDRLGVEASVILTGSLDDAALVGLYESADVYVTLSEHEGFCVPLVEAMFFDLPVIASTAGAIPETLGEAGLMVEQSATPADIAALVDVLTSTDTVRDRLIDAQRQRRRAFHPERLARNVSRAFSNALA